METYLVASYKPWNRRLFDEVISRFPGRWHYIDSRDALTPQAVAAIAPRYVFFLHWSWKVPLEIISRHECVCFHMTDLPYGRGGSPMQNLISRGQQHTKLSALRMTEEFDAGPVYFKEDLCLQGGAEEIFLRATRLSARMIERMTSEHPKPKPQTGDPVVFKRRKPADGEMPKAESLEPLFDHIRMLDAEDYPPAFLEYKGFRYEFSRPALYFGRIRADVTITPVSDEGSPR